MIKARDIKINKHGVVNLKVLHIFQISARFKKKIIFILN